MEFVKQNEELYKTQTNFKDKQRKEGLWERLAASKKLSVNTVKWFFAQCTRYGKFTHMNSGQAVVKNTERQTWLQDSFNFLRSHIRRKGVSKSSTFIKSSLRPLWDTASVPDTLRETKSEMEISMASAVTHQPSTTSPSHRPAAVATITAEDPVLDQFQQMK